ncbi:E3 ubiquitin-protein ligase rnf213-alpha isoform X2 [Paramormyrops kingsleyae]|uniref:E3 ubiquitin-protein ligase rnf213-alpha isoform X2 n=1 Tax=Paramormyrops kingsleyae TaxID=1676925 RepID=UPI003B978FDC
MKCPGCKHMVTEPSAKFCSECGQKLPRQQEAGASGQLHPAGEVKVQSGTEQETESASVSIARQADNTSSKRSGDEPSSNIKKKRKKKKTKKKTKKKEELDPLQSEAVTSELSEISLSDQKLGTHKADESSESESCVTDVDETQDSLQDSSDLSSLQEGSEFAETGMAEKADVNQGPALPGDSAHESEKSQTEREQVGPNVGDHLLAPDLDTNKVDLVECKDKMGPVGGTVKTEPSQSQPLNTSSRGEPEAGTSQQANRDQKAHVDPSADVPRRTRQETKAAEQNKETKAGGEQKVFGPKTKQQAKGVVSHTDPKTKTEKMEVQQSASATGESQGATSPAQDTKKEPREDAKKKKKEGEKKRAEVTPPERVFTGSEPIPKGKRVTIYFHAVLSKDFKIDPKEDKVFLRAGKLIGSWDENAAELSVTRDLGKHGFLVQGKLETTKEAVSVSIPYKYVVWKAKKEKPEFEYIYKSDTERNVDRCLFVKEHLLNEEGEWHQYDDIICIEPSKGVLTRLKNAFWPENERKVVDGRNIAGEVMLDTIFDLLRSWSDANLKSFHNQLRQFHQVYGNPFVYEEKYKKWDSLRYGEREVNNLMKTFMLQNVLPQMTKDGLVQSHFFGDSLKAGLVFFHVCQKYAIGLNHAELSQLCHTLYLPKMQKESFQQYWTALLKPLSVFEAFSGMVVDLILKLREKKILQWILLIPLLHFLKRMSEPFEPVPLTNNHKYYYSWAGLSGLRIADTALAGFDNREMLRIMKANIHLTEMDRLLPRSWMSLMTLEHLVPFMNDIPVDLLELLHLVAFKAPPIITYLNSEEISDLLKCIQIKCIDIEPQGSLHNEDYRGECLATSVKVLEKICTGFKSPSYTTDFTIPVTCINMVATVSNFGHSYETPVKQDPRGGQQKEKRMQILSEAMKIMRGCMSQTLKNRLFYGAYLSAYFSSEIEIWNNILSLSFGSEEFTKEWRQTFATDLEGKIKQESYMDQIEIYCNKMEELTNTLPYIAKTVEKCALQAVNSVCQNKSEQSLFEKFKINWKYGKLVSAIIQKSWPTDSSGTCYLDGDEVVLQHLLNWTAARNIFQLLDTDERLVNELSDDAKEKVVVASSAFASISEKFISGKMSVGLLNCILENQSVFVELLQIGYLSNNEQCKDRANMRRLMQWRKQEVTAVFREKQLVESLLVMCRKLEEHIKVDLNDLEQKQQIDIKSMTLDCFMEVHLLDEMASDQSGIVTFFHLSDKMRQMAKTLETVKDSFIFNTCWEDQAKEISKTDDDEELSESEVENEPLEMIDDEIFQPCYSNYEWIYRNVRDGQITLKDVDVIFEAYKEKYAELRLDLEIMCRIDHTDDGQWIERRIQQIEQYHELHLAIESAQVIMSVKETLCLKGNFGVLETLLQATSIDFKEESLDRIDNDLMQAKKILVDITESRRQCLLELHLRKNFVIWVKEALEDINELKVFVDLASISAGENDLDVDRVACFHDAVLGYASMLYDLKPDAGFQSFNEALKKLWKAFENDCNLPKKLRDTARHLEWLKTVKDSHGSVELSSLSLASAINKNGIYIISSQDHKKLSLETVLQLKIPEEHEEGQEMRCYNLEDLRELQNKLMLMSGKGEQGQQEVERFAEIFDNVQRLAEAFMDLFVAGNPLFRQWETNINCSPHSEAGIIMDFCLGSTVSSIIVEGNVAEQLPDMCRKMEKCLSFWKFFMDKQRSQYYYLNYYTAEQIVYLCRKLTQKCLDEGVDDQVLMMLSFIKPNCSLSDLRQTWHQLQYEMLIKNENERSEEIEFRTLFEGSDSMELATNFSGRENESLYLLNQVEQATGSKKLDLLWNAYMKDMSYFLPDCLDIRTLGRLLEILANYKDEEDEDEGVAKKERIIRRNLPKGLLSRRPNLIVCPHAEILTSCISIYMSSDHEQLPTYDEVLLCTASTSYEEVELLLRRCLTVGYEGEKIYTLLHADQLPYEVSYKVEQLFQQLEKLCQKEYRLVIICDSEREHTYLPSAFSQYRLHMVPLEPLDRVQRYLSRHYTVPSEESSAAAVFQGRLCVGLVTSERAGVGKSLYIQRLYEELKKTEETAFHKCIRLIEPRVDENAILTSLLSNSKQELTIFSFDVTSSVQKGLYEFLFKLLVLRYLMDSQGRMWKCSNQHLYVIEILQSKGHLWGNGPNVNENIHFAFHDVFPKIFCRPPKEVLEMEMKMQENKDMKESHDPLMDDQEFRSEAYQRPYQYLKRFYNKECLDKFSYHGTEGTHVECLQMLFVYCGVVDPSWAELRNFAWFLNLQLEDCENSVFCQIDYIGDVLVGFKNFVVDFMILMAKDFATPSLGISDQSSGRQQVDFSGLSEEDLAPFRIRKRWELEPHPYIFFNDDHESMTFIGFHLVINEQNGVDAVDPCKQTVIKRNVMTRELYEGLRLNGVPFNIDFDSLPRGEKIERLCRVLGVQWPLDPDENYELTTDNILKILAIHMRFRCGIPVIIMGETGCGKTRLIKFLCELRRSGVATENMKLIKVHGGTTSEMIYTKVREAEAISVVNKQHYGFDSVLFFDEANTTEAISSIKEVLCDNTVNGEHLNMNTGLQIIAACNPYRKHTDEMISRLESAGLGYRVRAEETDDKLGHIPLRQLVYRVQALPPSMIPLVWDFGQLNDHTEKMYIQQIVQRVIETNSISQDYINTVTEVLSSSQKYMRTKKDECKFVSLRDVERCMQSFVWFYSNHSMLLAELKAFLDGNLNMEKNGGNQTLTDERDPVLWSLIMAVGVCYHACLDEKENFRKKICKHLPENYNSTKVMQEISVMQDLFLSGVPLGKTIAKNNALKENVFMMVICIELRIPLFLVGKPGSSKSLSKTLVADAMQGQAAHSELYKKLKQVHLVSFQCSPHSTPEGIINTFKQCARFQEGKNLTEYISVVVLDEIGLAEDSPKMPLKTLHPLLEEGCIDDEPLPHKKVGFIGISNWALDPAKMNRGIFVSRGDPDEKELIESAKGICSSDKMILEKVRDYFKPFAKAYLKISKKEGKGFFGLRDYYSLIKMVFAATKSTEQKPTPDKIMEAVLRNFSGKDNIDVVTAFTSRLTFHSKQENIDKIELVRQNILSVGQDEECRYLLVLTKNYAALQILQQSFFTERDQPEIMFGSSFPKDQEYTQICRNINRVKICMETGQTIVLLNLQNLYESLYDALNQYYVSLGGQKYVDLGLGTHRVKCRVHKDFRLIVIEEKEVVYKQFPIPLINRLEKHYLDINTVLKNDKKEIVRELESWVNSFVSTNNQHAIPLQTYKYLSTDVFIGYHSDTCSSVVLQVTKRLKEVDHVLPDAQKNVLNEAKLILLNCATPDSVVRLDCTRLSKVETDELTRIYFEEQKHISLADYITSARRLDQSSYASFTEVTTFSRLLTASDIGQLPEVNDKIELLSLQQFDTEHSFLKKIRLFLDSVVGDKILIIQAEFDNGFLSTHLIASAKYSAMNEINKSREEELRGKVFVYFITKLPRMEGGCSYVGFHGGPWRSVHIDDLRRSKDIISDIKALRNLSISQLFEENLAEPEPMEVPEMYTAEEQTGTAENIYLDEDQTGIVQDMYMDEDQTETVQDMYMDEDQTETVQDIYIGEQQTETQPEQTEMETPQHRGWGAVLDTTVLVRSSVQSAVGMLRDQGDDGFRSTRRVEILLTLLAVDDELKATFLKIVKRRLHFLLRMRDENIASSKTWVFKEASNVDALQEGGTFRHTLWKRVQTVLTPCLAQLVSVIDRDYNLDLLLDDNSTEPLKRLWLDIFGNEKLLIIPYAEVDHTSETKTILVQRHMMSEANRGCSMPFSWKIKDFLDELWVYARQREGQTLKQFDEFFWNTPLGTYIAAADAEMQLQLFQRYLQDFISMSMKVTSDEVLQLLRGALSCCVNELRVRDGMEDNRLVSLPWVHAAYQEFKNRLHNLSRMLTIEPAVAQALLKNPGAVEGVELVVDVFAAMACVEHLEPIQLETDERRLAWLRQVKKLQVPIELVCSEEKLGLYGRRSQEIVRNGWNRIFSLSLIVEHMLLGIEHLEPKLKPVVLDHTQRLGKVLERNSDLKAEKPFEAVIRVLKECKDGVNDKIFKFGFQSCPVCLGDPQGPLDLPCHHIYCLACIRKWLIPGQMYCPLCIQDVPDDFHLKVSKEIERLIILNAQFRKQCNAFFIDLVSTMCFKGNSPPSRPVILHLLSFLMVEAKAVPIIRGQPLILTKALSPFDDSVDKNPVVRSVILKLLLKYSFEDVRDYLQKHLAETEQSNILEEKDKTELYSLYINCLEDSMFERMQCQTARECLQHEKNFLHAFLRSHSQGAPTATIDCLQQIARVRLCLDMAARQLVDQLADPQTQTAAGVNEEARAATPALLSSVVDLCNRSRNDWYRVYLIRKLCSQRGAEFVQKLLKVPDFRWLFPDEILKQSKDTVQMDQYLVHGEEYQAVREAVATAMMDGKMEGIDEVCERCRSSPAKKTLYLLLALFREVTSLYQAADPAFQPKPQLCLTLENFIQTSRVLIDPNVRTFATNLVHNRLGGLRVRVDMPAKERVAVELTVHLGAVLLTGNDGMMRPLKHLALDPAKMQMAFIPTMPDDMLAVARGLLGQVQWYFCPNGHPCTIGECGQPMEISRCLDCGAQIGGEDHKPVSGFQIANIQGDRTQTGHVLGAISRRDNPDMKDTKGMSPAPFGLIRLLTHMALLLGASAHPQNVAQIVKLLDQNLVDFLMGHLLKDFEQLGGILGKGVDDTVSTVHITLTHLMEQHQPGQWNGDDTLSTKEARNNWETDVATNIITPQLKHLDRRLMEVNALIRRDSRVSSNVVLKVVFGDPRDVLSSLPRDNLIHGPAVWSCRERVSLSSLAHILEQNDGKDGLPVLWRFLNKEAELRLVKFLPAILELQMDLVKKYQNVPDLMFTTIRDFLKDQKSEILKAWYEKEVQIFLTTWNQLRASLSTKGELKIPAEYCQKDLDLGSEFQVLLPRRNGWGLCSTALVSYLIALHNDLIYTVDKHTAEETSYWVSPADLTDLHVIHYELERDLIPLVLSNCQYTMERGQEMLLEYDLPKIQQQVLTRFLQGKPLITVNGIPTLVNRQDRNYENIFKDLKGKVGQEPLTALALETLARELPSYSDVCEALSLVEVALGFLAMTGGEAHVLLIRYLEDVLQMGDQMSPLILKALSRCTLKHCVALWQFLTSLKSESMLRLKRDPFAAIPEAYKELLAKSECELLRGFLTKGSVDLWLLETHELLLLVLKSPQAPNTYKPTWSLKDTLVSYMERKDLDVHPDIEEFFPEEICLSKCVEAWKFAVAFKQERSLK